MGKDDTFPFQDKRIRIPFRDMTTSEAEYHAETMWPYYDEKVSTLFDEKVNNLCLNYTEETIFNLLCDILGVDAKDEAGKKQVRKAFRILNLVVNIQNRSINLFYRFFVPWTIAASTGLAILLLKEYFPSLAIFLDKLKDLSNH